MPLSNFSRVPDRFCERFCHDGSILVTPMQQPAVTVQGRAGLAPTLRFVKLTE